MLKKNSLEIAAILLACFAVVMLTTPSMAQTKFLERIRKHYALDKSNGKCDLCHEPKKNEEPARKNLNLYGAAIQKDPTLKPLLGKDDKFAFTVADLDVVKNAAAKLDKEDSDKDGATNIEELDLGTLPGDPKSTPDKVKLTRYRKEKGIPDPATASKK